MNANGVSRWSISTFRESERPVKRGDTIADSYSGQRIQELVPMAIADRNKPLNAIAKRWINAHDEKTLFPTVSRTYISTVLLVFAEMAKD